MSTEDQKARVDALMALADAYAQAVSTVDTSTHECWRSIDYRNKRIAEQHAAREALRSALMSNAAPEVDMSGQRVDAPRRAALEEAAKVCEDIRDLKEEKEANDRANAALERGDDRDGRAHLRHHCTVRLLNGALERAAKAIRALADPLQGKEAL